MFQRLQTIVTSGLVHYLTGKVRCYEPFSISTHETLTSVLQTADILLVEGNQRFSSAVKYLTQSTWSHAALYLGTTHQLETVPDGVPALVEADLKDGVIAVPLEKYADLNVRICRAAGLSVQDRQEVAGFMVDSIGMQYDLKNIIDLARYLMPTPPVPVRWRRRMLSLGSGDPTRAICSTRIAQAFQSIGYPILPKIEYLKARRSAHLLETVRQVMHIRHHSLFTPRDFDVSPYFKIVKPSILPGFDHREMTLLDDQELQSGP